MTVHLLLLLNSLHETLNLNPTCFPHPSSLPKLEHNAKEVLGYILNNLSYKSWQHGGHHIGSFFSLFLH
jgi:hypothetical protein